MPARLTPDSNILISALVFGGNPLRLLEMALEGEVRLFISGYILAETLRVMRDKFHRSAEQLAEAQYYIEACTEMIEPGETLDVVQDDPDDNRVVECAVAGQCDAIITNDQDLLRLGRYREIRMMRVREFLESGV